MAASVSAQNKKFSKMTQRQKAVAVAKDVLKHLYMTDIQTGSYIEVDYNDKTKKFYVDHQESDAQKHINVIARNCNVCAIGACFLSHVRLFDDATIENVIQANDRGMVAQMKNAFSREVLQQIERAFESNEGLSNPPKDDKERLRVIMKNVVKNKGKFVPESGYVQPKVHWF